MPRKRAGSLKRRVSRRCCWRATSATRTSVGKRCSRTLAAFGRLDVLVNNAAEQHLVDDLTELSAEQLERTFQTNVYGYFFMTKAALPHLEEGAAIVNTTSVTAYRGSKGLLDYSATRGAIAPSPAR